MCYIINLTINCRILQRNVEDGNKKDLIELIDYTIKLEKMQNITV